MVVTADETLVDTVRGSLGQVSRVDLIRDALRITTHCLYPSNGMIRVYVRRSGSTFIVSDDRGAFNEAQSAGLEVNVLDRSLLHLVTPYGLKISNGTVFGSSVPPEGIVGAAIMVANASKAVAEWLYARLRVKTGRDFRLLLADLLQRNFETILHRNVEINGANKPHHFANVLSFHGGRRLLIDPVGNEPASYNSRIIANLDVKAKNDPTIEQRIVYDDDERWTPENLSLLEMGAIVVPFSRSQEVIKRLAKNA
jgi:hypothetical protein